MNPLQWAALVLAVAYIVSVVISSRKPRPWQ
jgi:hypothetical protein